MYSELEVETTLSQSERRADSGEYDYSQIQHPKLYEGSSPWKNASFLSRITFWWTGPLIKYAKKHKLDKELIGVLPEEQRVYLYKLRLDVTWAKWKDSKGNSLFWALMH